MDIKVVKWTFWGDPQYPEVDWESEEETRLYEIAVADAIRKGGYYFTGMAHQHDRYGTPVFNNGCQFNVSQRYWGGIMAEAYWLDSYIDWAWYPPKGAGVKYPKAEDWNESAEEAEAQENRWLKNEIEWLKKDCGSIETIRDFLGGNEEQSAHGRHREEKGGCTHEEIRC